MAYPQPYPQQNSQYQPNHQQQNHQNYTQKPTSVTFNAYSLPNQFPQPYPNYINNQIPRNNNGNWNLAGVNYQSAYRSGNQYLYK